MVTNKLKSKSNQRLKFFYLVWDSKAKGVHMYNPLVHLKHDPPMYDLCFLILANDEAFLSGAP